MDLTDAQWALLGPFFRPKRRADGRGRPWRDARQVLNGVLWILRTGAAWSDLPDRYPPYQTCHRRFQQWQRNGQLLRILQKVAEDLRDRGKLDLSEAFMQLQQGQKRGSAVRYDRRGKGCYIMAIADRHGLPLAVHVAGAGAHESGLVEATLQQRFLSTPPQRLIGDKAYDSAKLASSLRSHYHTQLIAPHRDNRCRKATQDGRCLRRARRRWRVERLFAWLQNFRRLVTRWERRAENYLGMIHLGCLKILLRYL